MSKEIVKKENSSIDTLIAQAIEKNVSIETMEKLLAMRDALQKEKARGEFVQAMANFQKECPVIVKDKIVKNKDGTTIRYKYAPIDSIVQQIQKPLSANGLAYNWTVSNEGELITATAVITHTGGHTESSSFQIPISRSEYMTAPQSYASALTFAKRYSLCNALGIATADEDTDATTVSKEKDTKSLKSKIVFRLKTLGKDADSKENIEKAVKELTKLELIEGNYQEIVARLEVLINEIHEENSIDTK